MGLDEDRWIRTAKTRRNGRFLRGDKIDAGGKVSIGSAMSSGLRWGIQTLGPFYQDLPGRGARGSDAASLDMLRRAKLHSVSVASGREDMNRKRAPLRLLAVAFIAALAATAALTTAFADSDAGVFHVPPPTGDPAADLAAINAALADAKAWQASQEKAPDELAAKVEVVLAPGTYNLCPAGSSTPAPPQGGGGSYCLQFIGWENLVFRGTGRETKIVLLDPDEGLSTSSSRAM
jgi:hypothetical protein